MRLQAEGAPDAADARGRDAAVTRHAARAPMRGSAGLAFQRLNDDALDFASSILRGTPGRGSSSSPSMPRSTKRRRHLPTVCTVTRSRAATALLLKPEAQPNTMRARNAKACAVLRRCV